jgi:hypothetical protein
MESSRDTPFTLFLTRADETFYRRSLALLAGLRDGRSAIRIA